MCSHYIVVWKNQTLLGITCLNVSNTGNILYKSITGKYLIKKRLSKKMLSLIMVYPASIPKYVISADNEEIFKRFFDYFVNTDNSKEILSSYYV